MEPKEPKNPPLGQPESEIDENKRAKELEETPEGEPEEVVGPRPGGGEESGHS